LPYVSAEGYAHVPTLICIVLTIYEHDPAIIESQNQMRLNFAEFGSNDGSISQTTDRPDFFLGKSFRQLILTVREACGARLKNLPSRPQIDIDLPEDRLFAFDVNMTE